MNFTASDTSEPVDIIENIESSICLRKYPPLLSLFVLKSSLNNG